MGRPVTELAHVYSTECKKLLSQPQCIGDRIHVSHFDQLSLQEYIIGRKEYCNTNHKITCLKCTQMLQVATTVLREGFCLLSSAFKVASPNAKYQTDIARRLLLQMPLVSVCVGNPSSGKSFTLVIEKIQGMDFTKVGLILNRFAASFNSSDSGSLEKSYVKLLLSLAQSDRERRCIKYAIFKASGVSATKARLKFGFESMSNLSAEVEEAITEALRIREAIDDIARVQDKSLLQNFGIIDETCTSSSDEDSETITTSCEAIPPELDCLPADYFKDKVINSNYNWFEICAELEQEFPNVDFSSKLLNVISNLGLTEDKLTLVTQSYHAYLQSKQDSYEGERIANMVNGDIVTDSESDNPEQYIGISELASKNGNELIMKRRAIIRRRSQKMRAKVIAEQNFLSRRYSKRVSCILNECPDIGTTIEKYVEDHNVGADSWRRTGVLTFDGNVNLKHKVTFRRIQEHLEDTYKRKFAFGSVVQLCVTRNKRRSSAKRYLGLAKVTTRRARKGFNIRYNPDSHWSAAFYKGLKDIQYKDGKYITNINRDDASGFRLDTLSTHKQYPTPVLHGQDVLTTRTDYVNKYSSTLQTTSYNFSATDTTTENCVGVVKAQPLHHKNPCQHAADLQMLELKEELTHVFFNVDTGIHKPIDCIRVDGASDEGPSHEEVQFYWTERHINSKKVATLVTTRSSGSSYLNRVELQNGCLALGHANTFIPSTLSGSCIDPNSGTVNENKLKENLSMAIDAYISRVDGCSCGDTIIHLYRGAESRQKVREKLLVFLKGSKKAKQTLMVDSPDLYAYFQSVWEVRNSHMVSGLPSQYIFYLICCYKEGCKHKLCQEGKPADPITWYPGGPTIYQIPFPVIDEERQWGCEHCISCKGFCAGHYKTLLVNILSAAEKKKIQLPPSTVLKSSFADIASDKQSVRDAAQSVLLPEKECQLWIEHLGAIVENRKRGAKKAAETRSKKKKKTGEPVSDVSEVPVSSLSIPVVENVSEHDEMCTYCGTCGEEFGESDDTSELWIGCDICDKWYHFSCEGLHRPPSEECYICNMCQQ